MKFLFELLPLIVFFIVFKTVDIYWATGAAVGIAAFQVGVVKWRHGTVPPMQAATLVILLLFGGLTVALRDPLFIQWKPSIVSWLFAAVIFGMLPGPRKSALEYALGRQISMPAAAWFRLNLFWGGFFLLLGLLNVYVAFYHNLAAGEAERTAAWVNFKVFVMPGLTLAFCLLQIPLIGRHATPIGDTR